MRRFFSEETTKPCVLGGIILEDMPGMQTDWDGDVLIESLIQAISTLVAKPLLQEILGRLFEKNGITDSEAYLQEAIKALGNQKISYVAMTIEGNQPKIIEEANRIRSNLARILHISDKDIGLSLCPGDGLSDVSCGDGLSAMVIITTSEEIS